jgi:SAM-dependent methyltransferase
MDNSAQIAYWNGTAGAKWVRDADRLDAMLQPFADLVLSAAKPLSGERVIDIGCGAGALSIAAAKSGASVTGVDISEPLVRIARERAASRSASAQFEVADASEWRPSTQADLVISRFGVMFFAEPAAAFANIRVGIKPGGRLAFACWQPLAENDWASAPVAVALPFLDTPPAPPPPGAPGPFAFGDSSRIEAILTEAGWADIGLTPWQGNIELPGADAEQTADFMLELGPLGRAIAEQQVDPQKIRAALAAHLKGLAGPDGRTRMKAAVWIVEARA